MPRYARHALALALLVLAAPPLSPARAGAPCKFLSPPGLDGWSTAYPGIGKLTALAVAPRHPDVMLVTDGTSVMRTTDNGCAWSRVALPAPDLLGTISGATGGSRFVADIAIPQVRKGTEPVWLLAEEPGSLGHPAVFRSTDGGATFGPSGFGLPPAGRGKLLAPAPDPKIAYVVVDLPDPGGRRMLSTSDGGGTWSSPAATTGGAVGGIEFPYDGLLVDPLVPNRLWAWNDTTLAQSYDGGVTFAPVSNHPVDTPIRDVAVGMAPRDTRVAVLHDGGVLERSDDGGTTWIKSKVDENADTVTAAPDLDIAAVAGPGVVTILPSIFTPIDATPISGADPIELTIGLLPGSQVRLAGRTDNTVLVHEAVVRQLGVPGLVGGLNAPPLIIPIDPALKPQRFTVTLQPGQTRDVDYELDVPAVPSPIDVFFLIDVTGSMSGVIDSLRAGLAKIVNDLSAAGIPAQFGVGEVSEYPFQPWSGEGDFPYKLLRKIGPVNDELRAALNKLGGGGGGDGPEAMTTGLYQMATGKGQTVNDVRVVDKGQDAGFRPGALHIALQSTDNPFHHEPNYPGPEIESVWAALNKGTVRVMGLAAASPALGDLQETAQETHTLAPAGGIDCNADGKPDLDEGAPLVCELYTGVSPANVSVGVGPININTGSSAGISSAIIALLRGIKDPANLAVVSSVPDVAKPIGRVKVPVDLKLPHAQPFKVRLSCPPARYGSTVTPVLTGLAGVRPVSTATVDVTCAAPAAPELPDFVGLPLVRPLVAAAAVPPAPPPAPVHNLNPNPQPNTHPNAQIQAGAAQQRQEQYQLALATGDFQPPTEQQAADELAFSDHRRMPAGAVPAAAGLMFTAAAAAAYRSRTRLNPARVCTRS